MATDPLVDIAWQLYDLPPARFTAERNARAKEVKGENPGLAERIGELRRASAAAWIVGQLVRHRAERLGQVLELGAELREAQQDLDAATLAQLTRDRRALTAALAREGAALAETQDVRATPAVLDEVAQTLQAAMADPGAADAVTSGRLIRSLEVVGFDPVDLTDAVAGPAPDGSPPRAPQVDEVAQRRARRAAERAVREAERRLERAEGRLGDARRDVSAHETRQREAGRRRDDLRAALAEAEDELAQLTDETDDLAAQLEAAQHDEAEAREALEAARRELES
ncbi:transposase [Microbacterium sp. NPDC096154]|uniref:transposase n=1 Tax=Microbacterium sp. NPDC096154 TaxID=3155549 RepID=UPI00331DA4CB